MGVKMSDGSEVWAGWNIHPAETCKGFCPFHNPSTHHMRDWQLNIRTSTLVERVCPHGIGHPDPDSLAYLDPSGEKCLGVHGCDGCCKQ